MNEIIRKRKSIRRYDKKPLDEAVLAKVHEQLTKIVPLYPDIQYSIEIADKTKGLLAQGSGASSFLVFRSEEKPGAYENIGFLGQQMDLYFSANGLGACWLGMAKPSEKTGEPYVISMAFGKPDVPLHRSDLTEFNRKALSEISEGTDGRLEAARLAPSGMNAQGWFFSAVNGVIHCYRKKPGLLPEKLGCIDMGIALWHMASESAGFRFINDASAPEHKGYLYTGTVSK
jgi:nitroreductase